MSNIEIEESVCTTHFWYIDTQSMAVVSLIYHILKQINVIPIIYYFVPMRKRTARRHFLNNWKRCCQIALAQPPPIMQKNKSLLMTRIRIILNIYLT